MHYFSLAEHATFRMNSCPSHQNTFLCQQDGKHPKSGVQFHVTVPVAPIYAQELVMGISPPGCDVGPSLVEWHHALSCYPRHQVNHAATSCAGTRITMTCSNTINRTCDKSLMTESLSMQGLYTRALLEQKTLGTLSACSENPYA